MHGWVVVHPSLAQLSPTKLVKVLQEGLPADLIAPDHVDRWATALSTRVDVLKIDAPRTNGLARLCNDCNLLGYVLNLFRENVCAGLFQFLFGFEQLHDSSNCVDVRARPSVEGETQQLICRAPMTNARANILSHLRCNLTQLLGLVYPLLQPLVRHLLPRHKRRVHKL